MVDQTTLRHRRNKVSYRKTVFYDILALRHVPKSDLMSGRNSIQDHHFHTIDIETAAGRNVTDCDGDIVSRIYSYEFHHFQITVLTAARIPSR